VLTLGVMCAGVSTWVSLTKWLQNMQKLMCFSDEHVSMLNQH
jgi:hypothetical protein